MLRSELLKKGRILQDFAYSTPGRNRYIGTPGHNLTVNYLADTLTATGYYDVAIQPFYVPDATASLTKDSTPYAVAQMSFTPEGSPTGVLVPVANLGCDAADYSAAVAGGIALISRGTCSFQIKVRSLPHLASFD